MHNYADIVQHRETLAGLLYRDSLLTDSTILKLHLHSQDLAVLVPSIVQLLLFHVVPYQPFITTCIFSSAEGSASFKREVGYNCLHGDRGEDMIKAGVVRLHCE